ncbi:sugar phosphate isomerase/epimerase family protein [Arundinibacter roseus]|uniref:Sugar phosphate isomerase/epimerase n=1 Tax=Arundinibacter roseus TaxID=2070510 RepID=A0A4R4K0P1_9BACT|nr:TIM barrel protein [Arundinibacter roseus]TDB60824.1 sugar phosphate isomerase/epimerase [Arundinibacter roseus]
MKKITIAIAAIVFLLGGLTEVLAQKKGKPLYTHPLGVQAYTYRNHFPKDVEKTLNIIQSLGITELEGGAPKGLTPEQFKKMCDDRGIKIPSTGAGYDELVKSPEEVAKRAKILGASYVMVAWIPHERGNFTLENAKKAVADFNQAGKVLKENGVTFCYHNHGYEFQPHGDGTLMDYLIQNTNPEYVSFEMDVLWTQFGGGDPVKLLKKYPTRWKLMHLKDLKKGVKGDLTGGTPAENDVPLGTGQVAMEEVIRTAKKVGVKHFFIEDESDQELEFVPISIAYLKSLKQ